MALASLPRSERIGTIVYGKSEDRADYQATGRPVAAMARDLPAGFHIPRHHHRRSQLLYTSSGAITATTDLGSWVVPPHRAVWVPAGMEHEMTTSGVVRMRTVYIESDARETLSRTCAVLTVGNLLRELILAAVRIPNDYDADGRDDRVMQLILDELRPASELPLHLPMPTDRRLLRVCEHICATPSDASTLTEFGRRFGTSPRTLERLFPAETGLSFSLWRQQARALAAIRLLGEGRPVTSVALDVGYESPSAFGAMFRRLLGVAPSDYFGDVG